MKPRQNSVLNVAANHALYAGATQTLAYPFGRLIWESCCYNNVQLHNMIKVNDKSESVYSDLQGTCNVLQVVTNTK